MWHEKWKVTTQMCHQISIKPTWRVWRQRKTNKATAGIAATDNHVVRIVAKVTPDHGRERLEKTHGLLHRRRQVRHAHAHGVRRGDALDLGRVLSGVWFAQTAEHRAHRVVRHFVTVSYIRGSKGRVRHANCTLIARLRRSGLGDLFDHAACQRCGRDDTVTGYRNGRISDQIVGFCWCGVHNDGCPELPNFRTWRLGQ